MSFVVFAWIACIVLGLETIIAKLTSKYGVKNPWLFNFVWELCVFVLMAPIALYNHAGIPMEWGNVIIASFFYTVMSVSYVLALQQLDVSVISPLVNFRIAFTVLFSALLLGEILTVEQYILVAVIFLFGIIVSLDEKFSIKSFFTRSIGLMMICLISISLMSIYIKKSMIVNDYWTVSLWLTIFTMLFLLPTIRFFTKDLRSITIRQFGAIGLLGVLSTAGELASNRAFMGNVSISAVIISIPMSMIMAFILSIVAPKLLEKHPLKIYAIRFISVAVMIWAAIRLSA
jgi:drug/metabolite transporter (DMT)-like permease